MKVSAIVVTRGDVDLEPILETIPDGWDVVVWNNADRSPSHGSPRWWRWPPNTVRHYTFGHGGDAKDVSVYGRYAAIEHATGDLVYVQDDDCVVSDPQKVVEQWLVPSWGRQDYVVCNMPQEFRHAFYQEHALVGFGAAFHRDAPERAFSRFMLSSHANGVESQSTWFDRTCDIVFTGLTPRVLVDVPVMNLPHAYAEHRMYRSVEHVQERGRMLERVMAVARG